MTYSLIKYQVVNEEVGDEYQLSEEMGLNYQRCFKCKNMLLDYFKTSKYTQAQGKREIAICLICFARNVIRDLDFRMQHNKEDILKYIELRKQDITPYKIVSHKFLKISMMTSFNWDKKFKLLISDGIK